MIQAAKRVFEKLGNKYKVHLEAAHVVECVRYFGPLVHLNTEVRCA